MIKGSIHQEEVKFTSKNYKDIKIIDAADDRVLKHMKKLIELKRETDNNNRQCNTKILVGSFISLLISCLILYTVIKSGILNYYLTIIIE